MRAALMTGMRFIEDWDPATVYDAVSFGDHWNGWETPVVTKETLQRMAKRWDDERGPLVDLAHVRFNGKLAIWKMAGEDDEWPMPPNKDDNYDLFPLGFCFVRVDDDYEYDPSEQCWLCTREIKRVPKYFYDGNAPDNVFCTKACADVYRKHFADAVINERSH